jgi:hypothetical protein
MAAFYRYSGSGMYPHIVKGMKNVGNELRSNMYFEKICKGPGG